MNTVTHEGPAPSDYVPLWIDGRVYCHEGFYYIAHLDRLVNLSTGGYWSISRFGSGGYSEGWELLPPGTRVTITVGE